VLSPNTLLADKYRIIAEIGEGGFGKVYLGYDVAMDRHVAIKELLRNDADASPEQWREYQARFRKEAQVTCRMAHSNVVSAYALETDSEGSLYLVLEYVDGGSLRQLLEAESPLEIGRAIDIAIDLCRAIEAIYKRDIVHRDIKPGNILLTRDGVAKLTDFGVAQVGHETRRTQDAMGHPGTPAYKSPEQATTTGYLDQRSDLYALGLVLYEMLTGYLYVRNRLPPRRFNSQVPHALNAIVMKALEENPADRYQLAADMRLDLERVRDEATLGQAQILWNRLLSNRVAAATSALILLAVAFLGYRLAAPLVGVGAPKSTPAPTAAPAATSSAVVASPIETVSAELRLRRCPRFASATLTPEMCS
jgi:serine/threonine-protein kinase